MKYLEYSPFRTFGVGNVRQKLLIIKWNKYIFKGCKEIFGDLCQQTSKQDQSRGDGPGHAICRWGLSMLIEWTAGRIFCTTLWFPSHSPGELQNMKCKNLPN